MPFAAPLDQDNDPNKPKQNGVNISGQSTSFATGVPGQDASTSGQKQKGSGQYANIQSYLDANKSQGDQMGQKITDTVGTQAEDAKSKITSFEAQGPQKIGAYDAGAAANNVMNLSDAEKATYKDQKKTGGYTGPQTVDQANGYQDAQKAAQAASQSVTNAGTEQGQQQLLKEAYARPQYSAGENRLDQVLLQNSAGSRSNLENLSQKYAGLDSMFNTAATNVGNTINANNAQALANRQSFAPAEEAAKKALIDPIQARANQQTIDNRSAADRIMQDASNEKISDETRRALGLTSGQKIFDLNLANYITPDNSQVGINNAATADERSKYAALSALFDDPTMNQVTADGKSINPVGIQSEKLQKDIASKDAEYSKAYNDQRGTVASFALNGFYLPGQLTPYTSRDLANATPSEVENYWIPLMQKAVNTYGADPSLTTGLNGLKSHLADWKSKYNEGRTA